MRILNNYRKVVDEEVSGKTTEDSADQVAETAAPAVTPSKIEKTESKKEFVKKSDESSTKETLNKRSGEAPVKTASNRMELKENLMKTVQNKNNKAADKQVGAINKNLYKKNADGSPRKPLDELRKVGVDRTTEQYVSVATTEYFETEEEKKQFLQSHKKVTTESNDLPLKSVKDAEKVKSVENIKLDRPAPTVATATLSKDVMHTKASENIINSIRSIMNNTHHMKQATNSEIHDAQIIVKAPEVASGRFNTKHDAKKAGETKTSTFESATDIDELQPTTYEKLNDKHAISHAKFSAVSDVDEKIRLRNTKVLEPTENDARAMPENLSNAFPWSWAKDILLEKPVAKKTAPNVEDIITDTDS